MRINICNPKILQVTIREKLLLLLKEEVKLDQEHWAIDHSIDPRVKDGKDIINRIKKREEFRPFAGTVLQEYAKEWFDMDRLDESPFMMYAGCSTEKIEQIPSIVMLMGPVDSNVTEEQNKNYYDVISEFHKITGVPILFNTSFNLAGDTMVDKEDTIYLT